MIDHLLLHEQARFDEKFDPPAVENWPPPRDQKVLRIQFGLARAALDVKYQPGIYQRQLTTETIPDLAIARSRLVNLVGTDSYQRGDLDMFFYREGAVFHMAPKLAEHHLANANSSLAEYLSDVLDSDEGNDRKLRQAAVDLHRAAMGFAAIHGVEDLPIAHQARLDTLSARATVQVAG